MSFSPAELDALRHITQALAGVDVVLIGAAALGEFGHCQWRATFDLDLTVALDQDEFPGPLAKIPQLRRDERIEHRWYAQSVQLDIIPAGPALRAQGQIHWRNRTMTLAGLHLAFEHAVRRTLAPKLLLRVAPPPIVAILKMISYCERPADRERDLGDIAELLERYVGNDDDRRFDDRVMAANLLWEDVSAHELGVDVARVITEAERPMLDQFLRLARGGDAIGTLARLMRVTSFAREEREVRVLQQLDAFVRGMGASSSGLSGSGG
jgi:predicted nucleotidyltransferase